MIDRRVLNDPENLPAVFDYYNDARDTIGWLLRLGTSEAVAIAAKLEAGLEKYHQWLRSRLSA